jgi:hypothetical protein
MKICIVVPIYGEYKNGNVFRLLESFTKQSISPSQYELICLVNNTPDVAKTQPDGYTENQLTLAIGRYLNGDEPLPDNLDNYREAILRKAKEI